MLVLAISNNFLHSPGLHTDLLDFLCPEAPLPPPVLFLIGFLPPGVSHLSSDILSSSLPWRSSSAPSPQPAHVNLPPPPAATPPRRAVLYNTQSWCVCWSLAQFSWLFEIRGHCLFTCGSLVSSSVCRNVGSVLSLRFCDLTLSTTQPWKDKCTSLSS